MLKDKGLLKKRTMYIFISFEHKWIQDPPFVIADKKWFWQKVIWSEMDVYVSIY